MNTMDANGFVRNCLIAPRADQQGPMFVEQPDGRILAFLDNYAIVPREEYERLEQIAERYVPLWLSHVHLTGPSA